MGLLVDGQWQDQWYDTSKSGGRFVRSAAQFRNWVTADGSPGPSGSGGFEAEPGRYHLYVSLACPWAHRTLIFRKLKGLEELIDVSVVHWHMGDHGWTFATDEAATGDRLYGLGYLHEVYTRAKPDYTGRVTVPVLWDKSAADHRLERVVRDHPHVQRGLRRRRRQRPATTTRSRCARRSTRSTSASTTPSTTASTSRASPPPRRPTRRR